MRKRNFLSNSNFTIIYRLFHEYTFDIAYKYTKNRDLAEKISGEVFSEIYQEWPHLKMKDLKQLKHYLALATRKRVLDFEQNSYPPAEIPSKDN